MFSYFIFAVCFMLFCKKSRNYNKLSLYLYKFSRYEDKYCWSRLFTKDAWVLAKPVFTPVELFFWLIINIFNINFYGHDVIIKKIKGKNYIHIISGKKNILFVLTCITYMSVIGMQWGDVSDDEMDFEQDMGYYGTMEHSDFVELNKKEFNIDKYNRKKKTKINFNIEDKKYKVRTLKFKGHVTKKKTGKTISEISAVGDEVMLLKNNALPRITTITSENLYIRFKKDLIKSFFIPYGKIIFYDGRPRFNFLTQQIMTDKLNYTFEKKGVVYLKDEMKAFVERIFTGVGGDITVDDLGIYIRGRKHGSFVSRTETRNGNQKKIDYLRVNTKKLWTIIIYIIEALKRREYTIVHTFGCCGKDFDDSTSILTKTQFVKAVISKRIVTYDRKYEIIDGMLHFYLSQKVKPYRIVDAFNINPDKPYNPTNKYDTGFSHVGVTFLQEVVRYGATWFYQSAEYDKEGQLVSCKPKVKFLKDSFKFFLKSYNPWFDLIKFIMSIIKRRNVWEKNLKIQIFKFINEKNYELLYDLVKSKNFTRYNNMHFHLYSMYKALWGMLRQFTFTTNRKFGSTATMGIINAVNKFEKKEFIQNTVPLIENYKKNFNMLSKYEKNLHNMRHGFCWIAAIDNKFFIDNPNWLSYSGVSGGHLLAIKDSLVNSARLVTSNHVEFDPSCNHIKNLKKYAEKKLKDKILVKDIVLPHNVYDEKISGIFSTPLKCIYKKTTKYIFESIPYKVIKYSLYGYCFYKIVSFCAKLYIPVVNHREQKFRTIEGVKYRKKNIVLPTTFYPTITRDNDELKVSLTKKENSLDISLSQYKNFKNVIPEMKEFNVSAFSEKTCFRALCETLVTIVVNKNIGSYVYDGMKTSKKKGVTDKLSNNCNVFVLPVSYCSLPYSAIINTLSNVNFKKAYMLVLHNNYIDELDFLVDINVNIYKSEGAYSFYDESKFLYTTSKENMLEKIYCSGIKLKNCDINVKKFIVSTDFLFLEFSRENIIEGCTIVPSYEHIRCEYMDYFNGIDDEKIIYIPIPAKSRNVFCSIVDSTTSLDTCVVGLINVPSAWCELEHPFFSNLHKYYDLRKILSGIKRKIDNFRSNAVDELVQVPIYKRLYTKIYNSLYSIEKKIAIFDMEKIFSKYVEKNWESKLIEYKEIEIPPYNEVEFVDEDILSGELVYNVDDFKTYNVDNVDLDFVVSVDNNLETVSGAKKIEEILKYRITLIVDDVIVKVRNSSIVLLYDKIEKKYYRVVPNKKLKEYSKALIQIDVVRDVFLLNCIMSMNYYVSKSPMEGSIVYRKSHISGTGDSISVSVDEYYYVFTDDSNMSANISVLSDKQDEQKEEPKVVKYVIDKIVADSKPVDRKKACFESHFDKKAKRKKVVPYTYYIECIQKSYQIDYTIIDNYEIYRSSSTILGKIFYVSGDHAVLLIMPENAKETLKNLDYNDHKSYLKKLGFRQYQYYSEFLINLLEKIKKYKKTGDYCIKSAIEYIEYLANEDLIAMRRIDDVSNRIEDKNFISAVDDVFVYNHHTSTINTGSISDSDYVINNGEFKVFYDCKVGVSYLHNSLRYLKNKTIIHRLLKRGIGNYIAYIKKIKDVKITLVNGVPGNGKTYSIMSKAGKDVNSYIATTAKESSYDIKTQIKNFGNFDKSRIKTVDGACMNQEKITVSTLHIDEACLSHFGQILLLSFFLRPKRIEMSGDVKQLPFFSRLNGFEVSFEKVYYDEIVNVDVTRRMFKNITKLFVKFYPNISTISKIDGVIRVIKIVEPKEVPSNLQALVFTQYEKSLLKKFNQSTITIHESQGKTYDHGCIVRIVSKPNVIYSSEPHIIVGCSRFRKSLTYYTVIEDDLSKFLGSGATTPFKVNEPVKKSNSLKVADLFYRKVSSIKSISYTPDYDEPFPNYVYAKRVLVSSNVRTVQKDTYVVDQPVGKNYGYKASPSTMNIFLKFIDNTDDLKIKENLQNMDTKIPEDIIYKKLKYMKYKAKNIFSTIKNEINSKLKTGFVSGINKHLGCVWSSIKKRNLDPPRISETFTENDVKKIVDRFFKTYFKKKSVLKVTNYCKNSFNKWYKLRTGGKKTQLNSSIREFIRKYKYYCHIKGMPKPDTENQVAIKEIASQVVTAANPQWTGELAGYFRELDEVLQENLKSKFLINNGISNEEMSGFLAKNIRNKEIYFMDGDMSKFDKSQGELVLRTQLEILKRFGMCEEILLEWEYNHIINILDFPLFGLRFKCLYQRRSGNIFTYLGNTILTMTVFSYFYDLETCICAIFSGDDSTIIFEIKIAKVDYSRAISKLFNLHIKIEYNTDVPYFCSKFCIIKDKLCFFVPDPFKAIIKLGRNDLYCKEHIVEYHRSLSDNFRSLTDITIFTEIVKKINIKYGKYYEKLNESVIFNILAQFVSSLNNYNEFESFYEYDKKLWERKLPEGLKFNDENYRIKLVDDILF